MIGTGVPRRSRTSRVSKLRTGARAASEFANPSSNETPGEIDGEIDQARPMIEGSVSQFRRRLLAWYAAQARDLPWRRSRDPYAIWVSEIMLQQTRVAAVLGHYADFIRAFPSIPALAAAREEEVLARWSGLGYYRRARQMHRAAQLIVTELGGHMPEAFETLRKLPGIGDYTAAAIASIAFGEAAAAIDGNVMRVIDRLCRGPKSATAAWTRKRAQALLDSSEPGTFNQAMMELGATVCLPQKPLCLTCPVQTHCRSRGEHRRAVKKQMVRRQISYALIARQRDRTASVLLRQRPASASQMPGMWELPEITAQQKEQILKGRNTVAEAAEGAEVKLRHSITMTNYSVRVLRISEVEGRTLPAAAGEPRQWIKTCELAGLPLTGLARKILIRLGLMPARDNRGG